MENYLITGDFFDIDNGETNKEMKVVNVIPTPFLDTCGYEHQLNVSLTCSGHHDVRQNKIESSCSTSVPEIPICNATEIGTTKDITEMLF